MSRNGIIFNTIFTLVRSIVYAVCFIGFFWWVAIQVRVFDARIGIELTNWVIVPGIALLIVGALIGISCIVSFIFVGKGTPAIFDPPREFVAKGPYRYCRNPMYIGGLSLLLGLAFVEHSISILIFFLVMCNVVQLFVIYYEEPGLKKRFGESYIRYLQTVPRWIPRFKN